MANQVLQINNRNNGIPFAKKASTVFTVGMFVQIDGTTGYIVPATNATPVLGITNEAIPATADNYATNDFINCSEASYNDEFYIVVSTGPATAAMVGRYLAIDAASTGVTITGISATVSVATPILVKKFVSATLIKGKVAFRF